MSSDEIRLKDLVDANAARIPVLEKQLQRLQRALSSSISNGRNQDSSNQDLELLQQAETQLETQKQEMQRETERQLKVMDEIDRRLEEITPIQDRRLESISSSPSATPPATPSPSPSKSKSKSFSSKTSSIKNEQKLTNRSPSILDQLIKWSKKSWKPFLLLVVIYLLVRRR